MLKLQSKRGKEYRKLDVDKIVEKKFHIAQNEILSKYNEIKKELDTKSKELFDKTYKQFEKTYGGNSREK